MARFFGEIGYAENQKTAPGVTREVIVEKQYYGDLLQTSRRLTATETQVNPNLTLSNTVSIVADAYAFQNFAAIRYVRWNGVLWTVSNVTVAAPRLTLQLGEVYNGRTG